MYNLVEKGVLLHVIHSPYIFATANSQVRRWLRAAVNLKRRAIRVFG